MKFDRHARVLLVTMLFASCAINKTLPSRFDGTFPLSESNYQNLNGIYRNRGVGNDLWDGLGFGAHDKLHRKNDSVFNCGTCLVKIEAIDAHHITASLMLKNRVIKEAKLTGDIVAHSFILKKRNVVSPALIIIWGWASSKMQLSLSKQHDLIVDNYVDSYLAITVMPIFAAGNPRQYDQRFVRVEN